MCLDLDINKYDLAKNLKIPTRKCMFIGRTMIGIIRETKELKTFPRYERHVVFYG